MDNLKIIHTVSTSREKRGSEVVGGVYDTKTNLLISCEYNDIDMLR